MCSIWMTLHLVLDVQPRRPCIPSFWVWLQMCLALQEGVALPKHLFWAALSLWQNGWGMWIPFHRRALSSVLGGIWRWYARCRYRESYCLAVCQISWMSIAMESKLLFGFDRWGHENEEVHGEPCPWFIAGPLPPKMKFPFDRIGKFTSCRIRMLRCTTSSKLSACSCSVMGFHKLHVLSFFIAQLPLLCLIYSSNTAASKNQNCQISNIDKMMARCLVCYPWQIRSLRQASSLNCANVTQAELFRVRLGRRKLKCRLTVSWDDVVQSSLEAVWGCVQFSGIATEVSVDLPSCHSHTILDIRFSTDFWNLWTWFAPKLTASVCSLGKTEGYLDKLNSICFR